MERKTFAGTVAVVCIVATCRMDGAVCKENLEVVAMERLVE